MYIPRAFKQENISVLHAMMRRYSFATLYSTSRGEALATHLPFMIDDTRGPHGTLLAHMAYANPQWRTFAESGDVLVVFLGPHSYISPSWYKDQYTVPTWNYAAIHAYGTPVIIDDEAKLRKMVEDLLELHEADIPKPWDARKAQSVIEDELKGIVGFEIPIGKLEGKFKFNQNRTEEDQKGVSCILGQSQKAMHREVAEIMNENLQKNKDD